MTRRDYVFLAEVFAQALKDLGVYENATQAIAHTARLMANRLAAANPRFDRERFLKAAGL